MTHGAHLGAEELSPVHQKLLTSRAGLSGPACQLNKFQQIVFLSLGKVTRSRDSKLSALIASSPLTAGTQAHIAQHFPGSLPGRPSGGAQTRGDTFGSPSEFVLLPGLVSRGAVCAGGGPEQFIDPFAGPLSACGTWGCAWSTASPALALQPPRPPTPLGV